MLMHLTYLTPNVEKWNKNHQSGTILPSHSMNCRCFPPEGVELQTPVILPHLAKVARYIGELNGLCESMPDLQPLYYTKVKTAS